ncbi:hypothetical protein LXL04_028762 [Taraxacum kok-saghyz]
MHTTSGKTICNTKIKGKSGPYLAGHASPELSVTGNQPAEKATPFPWFNSLLPFFPTIQRLAVAAEGPPATGLFSGDYSRSRNLHHSRRFHTGGSWLHGFAK